MPSRSPRKSKSRYSDPSNASLTPLTGNFSRISNGSRTQSLSPRKKDSKLPVHIRMHLTEGQVDRITDVSIESSPTKSQEASSSKLGVSSYQSLPNRHAHMRSAGSQEIDRSSKSRDTVFEDLLPRSSHQHASSVGLAERRKRSVPTPIRVEDARRFIKATPQRARMETVPDVVSPLNARDVCEMEGGQHTQSSYYPSEHHSSQQPEPLNIRRGDDHHVVNALQSPFVPHSEWRDDPAYGHDHKVHESDGSPSKQLRRTKTTIGGQGIRARGQSASPEKQAQSTGPLEPMDTPAFSPFPHYFRSSEYPSEKKGQKNMFGEKGWLERTDKSPDKGKKGATKKLGFLDGIKKMAKDVTDQYHPSRRANNAVGEKETLKSHSIVTLNAREQSLLYCELEFNLCNSLNTFIKIQLDKGRVDTDKLKKIGDAWVQQGRSRVVGFRYDLETQLELITLHIDDFVFSGRRQGNPTEIAALLYTMKVNARSMRIKTFCSPDSVVAKQLVDSQSLFNLIGAPAADNFALEECAHFYRLCLEKEAEKQEKQTRDARMRRAEGWAYTEACESMRANKGVGGEHDGY